MPKALRFLSRTLNRVSLLAYVAVLFGLVAGILLVATPDWMFENAVTASGLPGILPAAAPPLGDKARVLAAILAEILVAGTIWGLPTLALAAARRMRRNTAEDTDEIPGGETELAPLEDASSRRPLLARQDLGAPLMSDAAIAHACDELLLETVALDTDLPESPPVAQDDVAPAPEPAPAPTRLQSGIADHGSIPDLVDRLEMALERRQRRTGEQTPILPGDMAQLREALGVSALRH